MNFRLLAAAGLLACAGGLTSAATPAAGKPIRVILVGDSTMATRSGYGDAFCARFNAATTCLNLARGGRSSGSFRAEGLWDQVQTLLHDGGAYRATYVLIQFGHNDQPGKPGRSTDLATEFPRNMARYVQEVQAAGGVAVLVTPLTRRSFKDHALENNLQPWAEVVRNTAAQQHAPLLDLNAESFTAVQMMGQDEADTLAMVPRPAGYGAAAAAPAVSTPSAPAAASTPAAPSPAASVEVAGAAKSAFDRTHLGAKGAAYFSRMVARELAIAVPDSAGEFKPEVMQ
jgi:lysophospholipase L1-like esterase